MGNLFTGDIYPLAEGAEPNPGDVPLTSSQAAELRDMDVERRKSMLRALQAELDARKPTIADLERILDSGLDTDLQPDGRIVLSEPREEIRPLTLRENLGGEYGE